MGTVDYAIQAALTHYNAGRWQEAEAVYREILQAEPKHPDALHLYYNLGNTLQAQGKLDEAVESYRNALTLKPDYTEALNNSSIILRAQGKLDQVIVNYKRALQLRASPEIKTGFVQYIKNVNFTHEITGIRPLVIRAISEPWGRPSSLVVPSLSLIRLNHGIKACIDRAANAWPVRLSSQELFGSSGLGFVANDQLLQCLLENVPISNMGMERFLTMTRLAMLNAASRATVSDMPKEKILAFYCALSRQCFINEYIFAYADEEFDLVRLLRERLVTALESGSPIPVLWLVAVAAYFPLFSLKSIETVLDLSWPESITALLMQQVREPMEELQIRANIPRLTTVEDDVSGLVQQQYEENPYPRWVKMPSGGKATTVDAFLRERFPFSPFKSICKEDEVDILVAGCGTGQHPIGTAQQFCGARVFAIDLSLTSLSYAIRKTNELGLKNIEYAQADIMKIGSIGRTFDVIESIGVLHHLADPLAGWRILLSLLRPGGFMRLGFYSELARQNIVAARSLVVERGYTSNAENIRRFRQDVMAMENSMQLKQLTSNSDFYGASACRDLIFHVQEHLYTLPMLKNNLGELGLRFIGFILEPYVLEKYEERFPDDRSKTNLDYWDSFEKKNPNTFASMYQFWVQKCV